MRQFIWLILVLVAPGAAQGCGVFLSPPIYDMYWDTQQAFIAYDAQLQQEQLTVLPRFYGDAPDFAWVIPVPGLPEVQTTNAQLFRDLGNLTRPVHHRRDGDWDCFDRREDYVVYAPQPAVDVIDQRLVGYYQTMTLAAAEAPALLDSLASWGFLSAEDRPALEEAVADYVNRSWYFVTVRIDSVALNELYPHNWEYFTGSLEPIQLTFDSDEILYPLQISALSTSTPLQLNLYVKTDHRQMIDGGRTLYANRFSAGEIASLPYLQDVFGAGDFVTQLARLVRKEKARWTTQA